METWKLIVLGVTGLFVAAILIEVWLTRGKSTGTLADTLGKSSLKEQADEVPLGMEEIDMDIVREAERLNTHLDQRRSNILSWHKDKKK